MKLSAYCLTVGLLFSVVNLACAQAPSPSEYRVVDMLEIDKVPSWFPVGFCLLTQGEDQYAAYYDEEHHMTVAHRRIKESHWQKVALPSQVGWDSHNYMLRWETLEAHHDRPRQPPLPPASLLTLVTLERVQ